MCTIYVRVRLLWYVCVWIEWYFRYQISERAMKQKFSAIKSLQSRVEKCRKKTFNFFYSISQLDQRELKHIWRLMVEVEWEKQDRRSVEFELLAEFFSCVKESLTTQKSIDISYIKYEIDRRQRKLKHLNISWNDNNEIAF